MKVPFLAGSVAPSQRVHRLSLVWVREVGIYHGVRRLNMGQERREAGEVRASNVGGILW